MEYVVHAGYGIDERGLVAYVTVVEADVKALYPREVRGLPDKAGYSAAFFEEFLSNMASNEASWAGKQDVHSES